MIEFVVKRHIPEEAIFDNDVLNTLLISARNEAKEKDFTYLYEVVIVMEGEDFLYNARTIYFKFKK
jgi:hypothetical protein